MQINSVGSSPSTYLLTKKVYSAGTVVNRLIQQLDSSTKLDSIKDNIKIKEKVTDIAKESSKMTLPVNDIESLEEVDSDLNHMLRIEQYATGNISSGDRKKCQDEIDAYTADINSVGKSEQEQLDAKAKQMAKDSIKPVTETSDKTAEAENIWADSVQVSQITEQSKAAIDALKITDEQSKLKIDSGADAKSISAESLANAKHITIKSPDLPRQASAEPVWRPANDKSTDPGLTWTQRLDITNLSVATVDGAKDAVNRTKSATEKVESELEKLTKTETDTKKAALIDHSAKKSTAAAITDSSSAAAYIDLLKSCMTNDSTKTVVAQSSNCSSQPTATVMDTTC